MPDTTLTVGSTTVDLGDLLWADEFAWQPVAQQVDRSLTGALLIQAAALLAGRPVTLTGGADDRGWISRATLLQCTAWAAVPGQVMTLAWRGSSYSVIWRHQDGAIEATPVDPRTDDAADDDYRVTLRLMVIA